MEFKKLNAPSLRELFVNELQNMILSGKLEIGSKLPPERELAESMKVSRAVINSGIAELEKKGFLVVRPRIGTFVADYHRDGSLDTLVAIMNYNGGVLKNREVKSVLEARIMFMVEASQFAIDRASDKELLGSAGYNRAGQLQAMTAALHGCETEKVIHLLLLLNGLPAGAGRRRQRSHRRP